MGLGAGAGQFSLTAAEFTQITSSGMSIGGSMCGSQTIDGVANANSAGIGGGAFAQAPSRVELVCISGLEHQMGGAITCGDDGLVSSTRR